MPRLWVKRITSVGAVEVGDNPAAEILFFKARDPLTGEGLDTQPRERGVQEATSDVQRPERRIAERRQRRRRRGPDRRRNAIAELVAKAIREQTNREATMPKKTADEEVAELAAKKRLADPTVSLAKARAEVWAERPDLKDRSRSEAPAEPVAKKAKPETLSQAITRGFDYRAGHLQMTEPFLSMPLNEVRVQLYKTAAGAELLALSRSPEGRLPVGEALTKVSKTATPERSQALDALKSWAGL